MKKKISIPFRSGRMTQYNHVYNVPVLLSAPHRSVIFWFCLLWFFSSFCFPLDFYSFAIIVCIYIYYIYSSWFNIPDRRTNWQMYGRIMVYFRSKIWCRFTHGWVPIRSNGNCFIIYRTRNWMKCVRIYMHECFVDEGFGNASNPTIPIWLWASIPPWITHPWKILK